MDMIVMVFALPLGLVLIGYLLHLEEKKEKKEEEKKIQALLDRPANGMYPRKKPSRNERRRKVPMTSYGKPVWQPEEKSRLERFLDKYGKEIARNMESESFVIAKDKCQGCEQEIIEWLSKFPSIDFALIEEDGIHVKIKKEV